MRKVLGIFIMISVLMTVTTAFSQPRPQPRLEQRNPRKQILMLMKLRMIEELDLSEEQTNAFFPKFNELQDLRKEHGETKEELVKEIEGIIQELEDSNGNESSANKSLEKKVEEFIAVEKDFRNKEEKLFEEMLVPLSSLQKAKFLIFQERFHRELRETVESIRRRRMDRPTRE